MEKTVLSLEESRSRAARYCASAEHCEAEVREKLRQWGTPSQLFGPVVDFLYDHRFLDDDRYCQAYVHDQFLYRSWGRIKIRAMLCSKHLPQRSIDAALLTIDADAYRATAERLIEKKKGATRDQVARLLLSRGFEWEVIAALLPSE